MKHRKGWGSGGSDEIKPDGDGITGGTEEIEGWDIEGARDISDTLV